MRGTVRSKPFGVALFLAACASTAMAEDAEAPGRLLGSMGLDRFSCSSPPVEILWPSNGSGPLACLQDGRLIQWDPETGVRAWNGRRLLPNDRAHAFSSDGAWVAYEEEHGTVQIMPLRDGKAVTTDESVQWGGYLEVMAFSKDSGRIAAAWYEGLVVWDARTGKKISSRKFDTTHATRAVVFSDDGDSVLMARDSHGLSRISVTDETAPPEILNTVEDWAWFRDLTPATATRVSGDANHLDVVDLATGKSVRLPVDDNSKARAISRDGHLLAQALPSGILQLWNARTGELLHEITGPWGIIDKLAISPDGKRVAATGPGLCSVFVVEVETGRCVPEAIEETASIVRLAASPDGRFLASLSVTNALCLWDISLKRPIWRKAAVGEGPVDLAFWPDGSRILIACGAGLEIFDAGTGKLLKHLKDERGPVRFTSDGRKFGRSVPGGVGVCLSATLMEDGLAPTEFVATLAFEFTRDERSVCILGEKETDRGNPDYGELVLRAVAPGGTDRSLLRLKDFVLGVAISPDTSMVALRLDESTRVLDANTGLPLFDLKEPGKWLLPNTGPIAEVDFARNLGVSVAWSPDGRLLYCNRGPGKLGVIDVASGRRVLTIAGPSGPFALIPGTTTLAMAGSGGRVEIHDATIPVRSSPVPGEPLFETAWSQLAVTSGRTARRAASALVRGGDKTSALLEAKLRIEEVPAAEVDPLIARLRDENVETRAAAEAALRALGSRAEPALRRALAVEKDPEARARIDAMLHPLLEPTARTAGQRRNDWAVRILEEMGARDVLGRIADGSFPGRTRAAASAALERLRGGK